MDDPFESSKESIAWAKDQLAELQRQAQAFIDGDSYKFVIEPDSDGLHEFHKVKLIKPIPRAIRFLPVDIINNLRSALDQSVYSVALLSNVDAHGRYFPIATKLEDLRNALKGRFKDLPAEITELVRSFKPYKRGNPLLWTLNNVSGTNKHGIVRPVATARAGIHITSQPFEGDPGAPFDLFNPIWDRAKNEMVFGRFPRTAKAKVEYEVGMFIAIHEVEFVDGLPVVTVLDKFIGIVESIVMAIEAESKRIGLI